MGTRSIFAGMLVLSALGGWACSQARGENVPGDPEEQGIEEATEPGIITISAEARANIGLTVERAEEREIQRTLLLNATLKVDPDNEAFVSSRVRGKVTAVYANVGDVVVRGQPLVTLQSLQIAETPPTVEIESPLDGVVLERSVTVGETVDPTTALFHVGDLSYLLAEAEVYEADLADVRPRQVARLRAVSYSDRVFTGRVVRLEDAIEPVRRTLRVWIKVDNTSDRLLKPGMFAQVNLVVATTGQVVTVSNEAVQTDGLNRFVFVQKGKDLVRQDVVVGERDDRYTAITRGVFSGDLVVTQGAVQLRTVARRSAAGGVVDENKPHSH